MTISFDSVPTALLVPFIAAEFDSSRASQGPALLTYRSLLIGQKTGEGTATVNTVVRVTNADQVATYAGRGSQLHRQALMYFKNNRSTETWIGVLADNSAGVFAGGTLTVSGTAAADGTLSLYVGGNLVSVGVSSGDTASTIATAIAAELGIHASGTVTFATATAGDNITVGATTFVATAGAVVAGAATYSIDTSDNAAATSLAAQVNAHAVASTVVRAEANSAVVTLRAVAGGTAGNAVVLTSVDGVTTAVTGSGTLTNGGTDTDLPVFASVSSAAVTVRARNKGPQGNDIDLRLNYADGQETPAGVTLSISDMASGATNPTLTSLITALGDTWYHVIAHPYTDSTSLTAIEGELSSRFGPMRMIDGVAITSAVGSVSTLGTLGDTRNSQHSVIVAQPGADPLTPPAEFAAGVAGVVAYYANIDSARPFQTLQVKGALPPAESDLFTLEERNTVLYDGIATSKAVAGGGVAVERLVTTYQRNAAGSPDTAYRDVTTMLTLLYLRYSFRTRVETRYPRHKLASDGARVGAGQPIITPKIGKAEAILWFRDMELLGLVENFDQFKTDLVCERDVSDPNRLNWLLPPDIMNQFIVGAAKIQFLL
jgi:phage tail sheath gpL-like